ncbi:unnamed protein product, partial [Polarella glacialis]
MEERLKAAAHMDKVIDRMLAANKKAKSSKGSIVSLPKAELDLLSQIELARDFIMEVLKNQNDRTQLQDVFGGDCTRLASIRAICESIEFSDMNKGDQRLSTCLRACASVENIVVDLGFGEDLRKAQDSARTAMDQAGGSSGQTRIVRSDSHPGPSPRTSPRTSPRGNGHGDTSGDGLDRQSGTILSLVKADAERREARLRQDWLSCESRLQEFLTGSE